MKKSGAFLSSVCLLTSVAALGQAPPQAEIKSGAMSARIYLPNAQNGYYRSVRFEWGGVINDLEVAGHHLYRPWFTATDPAVSDFVYKGDDVIASPNTSMTGPAEEFQKPLGYDTARPGETFLKVGIGLLKKIDDKPYAFTTKFELVDSGQWTTSRTADSITFTQTFRSPKSPYSYIYTKTFRLIGASNQLIIEHRLRNTGKKAIETTLYDHNFLTVDGKKVGTDYSVTVPYTIKPIAAPDENFVHIEGHKAEYVADLNVTDRVQFGLQGFSSKVSDYDFRIVNKSANLEIRMVGDRPLTDASIWSIRPVIAVEPFIAITAQAGQDFTWKYTYTYTDLSKK